MGQLTRLQVVTQGLLFAGKPSLSTLAPIWLNAWLKSTYEAWTWPWLVRQAAGIDLPAGTQTLTVGAGVGGIAGSIQDIFDPIYVYTSDFSSRGEARVRQLLGGPIDRETEAIDPTRSTGIPLEFKARESASVEGQWDLLPYPYPDKAYKLALNYKLTPDAIDPSTVGDSVKPRYPNDRTLMQVVCVEAWKYMGDERYIEGLEILRSLVTEDKMKHGTRTGINDVLGLDQGVFGSQPPNGWWRSQ